MTVDDERIELLKWRVVGLERGLRQLQDDVVRKYGIGPTSDFVVERVQAALYPRTPEDEVVEVEMIED